MYIQLPPSSGRTSLDPCVRAHESVPSWPMRQRDSSWQSTLEVHTRESENTPTGLPDWMSNVSSFSSACSSRTIRIKRGPVAAPPCLHRRRTISSSGFSATSGSRLFISSAAPLPGASSCKSRSHRVARGLIRFEVIDVMKLTAIAETRSAFSLSRFVPRSKGVLKYRQPVRRATCHEPCKLRRRLLAAGSSSAQSVLSAAQ